jgi:Fe-S cluster assembly scaffold protein SufB
MIHNWAPEVVVQPRSGIIVEEGGTYINNHILMKPVKDVQMYPVTYCNKNARTMTRTVIHASQDSKVDIGSKVVLEGENSRAELISRSIATDQPDVTTGGEIVGSASGVKGHLECIGIMHSNTARIHSISEPGVTGGAQNSRTRQRSGGYQKRGIAYLTARGLSEDETAGAIVRGFLNVDIKGLPPALGTEVRKTIQMSADTL